MVTMIKNESLPYFGKINSISRIIKVNTEDEKYYLIKRYDNDGNEKNENFVIPINLKNTNGIIMDYCRDIKDYLTKNETKYIELKKKDKVFNINISKDKINLLDKVSKAFICLGTVMVGLTFSVVLSPMFFYMGMAVLVMAGIGNIVISDINKELDLVDFIDGYDKLSMKLNEYKSYLDTNMKNELTLYKGLSKTKNKGNNLKLKKIKTLN